MSPNPVYRVEAASQQATLAVLDLFDRSGTSCFCQWWHFGGDKNAWLNRCANSPVENRAALQAELHADTSSAFIAIGPAEQVVGWLRISRAADISKLYAQRLYKGLPCFNGDRTGVYTVGCLFVDAAMRRQGVARSLLETAISELKAGGAQAIEAFPRRGPDLGEPELWLGPLQLYIDLGFEIVNEQNAYPVLRRRL